MSIFIYMRKLTTCIITIIWNKNNEYDIHYRIVETEEEFVVFRFQFQIRTKSIDKSSLAKVFRCQSHFVGETDLKTIDVLFLHIFNYKNNNYANFMRCVDFVSHTDEISCGDINNLFKSSVNTTAIKNLKKFKNKNNKPKI